MATVSGCDGRCCSVFVYPSAPDELRERWEGYPDSERKRDDLFIADMLIGLTADEAQVRVDRFGVDMSEAMTQSVHDLVELGYSLYTCKHWDEDTRLCTAYDERPKMCQEYPYTKKCEHGCGCYAPMNTRVACSARHVAQAVRNAERPPVVED